MRISNNHFDIEHILECGQAFRYSKLDDYQYDVIGFGKRVRVVQKGKDIEFLCSDEDYNKLWINYFDLKSDYGQFKKLLIEKEPRLAEAIEHKQGIRILRQEPFEMLITFILSQNKSMPQIKVLVNRLSTIYGTEQEDEFGKFNQFPSPQQLAHVTEAEFRELKVGFRAPYLVDAIHKVVSKQVMLESMYNQDTQEAREALMSVKGVGRKVSDCVLLFGFHKMDVFPLDVWMKRIMNHLYSKEDKLSDTQMLSLAEKLYGKLGGLAQQYLFYHYIKTL